MEEIIEKLKNELKNIARRKSKECAFGYLLVGRGRESEGNRV